MGLDQYAYTKDVKNRPTDKGTEIAYWRKHNRLQGWMDKLWHDKGNTDEFNCKDLVLTESDIDALELAIAKKDLPMTEGFFFGRDSYDADGEENYPDYDSDVAFIAKAREAFANDLIVYYSCWW